jgi:tetratricopeptide (TPR) repeat protein
MSAQSEGEYAEALQNYYEAMRLEIDPYDRSYILYNIGLIHTSNGEHAKALEYYFQALERNPSLPQAFNNMAVICHYVRLSIEYIFLVKTTIILNKKSGDLLHKNH